MLLVELLSACHFLDRDLARTRRQDFVLKIPVDCAILPVDSIMGFVIAALTLERPIWLQHAITHVLPFGSGHTADRRLPVDLSHPANCWHKSIADLAQLVSFSLVMRDEPAGLEPNLRLRVQTANDAPDVDIVNFAESPWTEFVIAIFSVPVMDSTKRNRGKVGGFLAQSVRPGMRSFDSSGGPADDARQRPYPRQVETTAWGFHASGTSPPHSRSHTRQSQLQCTNGPVGASFSRL